MLRLQTYFQLALETPNLVWDAIIIAWPWQTQMMQEAEAAGFQLMQQNVIPNCIQYRRQNLHRTFNPLGDSFVICDVLMVHGFSPPIYYWKFQPGLCCCLWGFDLERISFKAGYSSYQDKT